MATVKKRKPRTRGNGQDTAFKRGNTWTAQVSYWVTVDGKKKRKYKSKGGFKLKRDALAYIDSLQNGDIDTSPTITFNAPSMTCGVQTTINACRRTQKTAIERLTLNAA